MRRIMGRGRAALLGAILALGATGSARAAFQQLPPGDQVNNDPAAGIDPTDAIDILFPPANSDVAGGSLSGGVPVPWAIFRQTESPGNDQIFVRSFADGHWTTRGAGVQFGSVTHGARPFSGSLNFQQDEDGETPSIDFAGPGRAVPWATWGELNSTFGKREIFASRFDQASNTWIFSGRKRGFGEMPPSLNIHHQHDARNPVVAGGSTSDPTRPGPWVTWQEKDNSSTGPNQIFVSRPIGPGTTSCPAGTEPAGYDPVGGFCFQQVGIERVDSGADVGTPTVDPSLNVDRARDGIEPDIAFTGPNDSVPWVVWYEVSDQGHAESAGLHHNDMVFAAKATANAAADGGFQWTAVGGTGSGVLDATTTCAASAAAEAGCSLNADANADAVDPRVAAGTMTPGSATVPWVAWQETSGGHERIFVSRLVNGRFEIANNGQPLPTAGTGIDATRPDITFSGNTPYVSWHEGSAVVYGHFATPGSFVIDNGPVGTNVPLTVRAPISSGCTATPFNGDGASCQAGAVGTPFFLFTDGDAAHAKLLADAYQTDAPVTGAPTVVGSTAAGVTGTVNPQGAPVKVRFEFGTTTAYGQTTAAQKLGPANVSVPFAAVLSGLPASTTIHYRAVAVTDFGVVAGPDRTLTTTASPPAPKDKTPPHLRITIRKSTINAVLRSKRLKVRTRIDEAARVRLGASARGRGLGKARVTFTKAGSKTVSIRLTKSALRRLRHAQRVTIKVTGKATDLAGNTSSKRTSRTLKRR